MKSRVAAALHSLPPPGEARGRRRRAAGLALAPCHPSRGFALVSALIFLLVITLIGVSLFLGVNLQQKASGNALQKTRALQLAKTVTLSAERWLASAPVAEKYAVSCAAQNTAFRVCLRPPANPSRPSQWGGGATRVTLASLNLTGYQNNGIATYFDDPEVWISYLGHATMAPGKLYLIYAHTWGGNRKSQVVTQTVFYVGEDMQSSTGARNLGS